MTTATSHDGDSRLAVLAAAVGRHPILALTRSGATRAAIAEGIAYVLPDVSALPVPLVTVAPKVTEREMTGRLRVDERKSGDKTTLTSGKLTSADAGVLHLLDAAQATAEQVGQIREAQATGEVAFELVATRQRIARDARFHFVAGASGCACADSRGECSCPEIEYAKAEAKIPPRLRGFAQIMLRDAGDPGAFDEQDIALVRRARLISRRRLMGTRYSWNGDVGRAPEVVRPGRTWWAPEPTAAATFRKITDGLGLRLITGSTSPYTVLSLAWTLADLRGIVRPRSAELHDALRLHRPELAALMAEMTEPLS
jgi:magnesium chelatase family protein